jgi:uncharacterized LabA/DUF88 family protein
MWEIPSSPRAVAFVDGQNLFYAAKEAFGYRFPNYALPDLAEAICKQRGWSLTQVRFYTGVPAAADNPVWNQFWAAKLGVFGHRGVHVYSRLLRYRHKTARLSNGTEHAFLVAEEKGIDVRIALDIIRLAHHREFDVALVFSQDQDLSEVADEIRTIAKEQDRWLKMVSAFPSSAASRNRSGIAKTDWVRIDRPIYDACLDRQDYRPPRSLAA